MDFEAKFDGLSCTLLQYTSKSLSIANYNVFLCSCRSCWSKSISFRASAHEERIFQAGAVSTQLYLTMAGKFLYVEVEKPLIEKVVLGSAAVAFQWFFISFHVCFFLFHGFWPVLDPKVMAFWPWARRWPLVRGAGVVCGGLDPQGHLDGQDLLRGLNLGIGGRERLA